MFTQDFKEQPYWWDRSAPPTEQDIALPKKVDVLIIGAGYTGLHAAIQTARGSRNTLVIDAEHAGWGCSTRNGGQVSTSVKPSFPNLKKNTVKIGPLPFIWKVKNHYNLLETSSKKRAWTAVMLRWGISMPHTTVHNMKNLRGLLDIPSLDLRVTPI